MSSTNLLRKLWNDDRGALISTEWLFVVTILVIGLVVGLAYIRNAVTSKFVEIAQAITFLNVGYRFPGIEGKFRGNTFTNPQAWVRGTWVNNPTTTFAESREVQPVQTIAFDNPAF
jgi:hypothetical protein